MSADAAAQLRDQITLLERSLADAADEHERGELDDRGLDDITRRDGARLADARARLDALAPDATRELSPVPERTGPVAGARPTRRRPRWLLAVAVVSLAAAVAVVVVAAADPFAPAPPPIHATISDQVSALLGGGEVLLAEHHPLRALTAFEAALRLDPSSAEALVESGWLRYEFAGLAHHDRAQVDLGYAQLHAAVRRHPSFAAAHLYDGIVVLQHDHDRAAAKAQFLLAEALPESADDQAYTQTFLSYLAQRPG